MVILQVKKKEYILHDSSWVARKFVYWQSHRLIDSVTYRVLTTTETTILTYVKLTRQIKRLGSTIYFYFLSGEADG